MKGQKNAMGKDALAGKALFDNTLNCKSCHPAPYFTTFKAENNGLYAVYGKDKGRFRIDLDSSEIGFFKIPSLRNIALTYPYMHDGSLNSLTDVLKHYMEGGKHPKGQSTHVKSFSLSITEQKQIIAFLNALTDTSYLKNFKSK
jgi:cytochrome c peroxidase